jgi:hypothetical protein
MKLHWGENMLYDVEKIAELTGFSKVTIYRKMKLHEIIPFITVKNGKQFLTEEGFIFIKDMFNIPGEEKNQDNTIDDDIAVDSEPLNLKDDYINTLKGQLMEKDQQIKDLITSLNKAQDLTKNMQILQLRQQPQDIKVLEAHFQELDTKLLNIRERMDQKKDQEQKGIFKKLFKK